MTQQGKAEAVSAVWETMVLGNPVWAWLLAAGLALGLYVLALIARRVAASRARRLAERRPTPARQLAARLAGSVNRLSLLVLALAAATLHLALSAKVEQGVRIAVAVAAGVQAVIWGRHLIDVMVERLLATKKTPDGQPDPVVLTALTPIRFISTAVLLSTVVLIVLDNAGVNVTALVAGLGIGGVAVALAAQNILTDLFAAVSIVVDKPFMVGDSIVVDDKGGTVESIGLKTTRVRAVTGEQLIFSNSDLLKSRVQNFKRMQDRRLIFTFGVTYETPPEVVRRIPGMVREAIERRPILRFERCHFVRFGESALVFEAAYVVNSPDFNAAMDVQEGINLELMERFRAEGVRFAYPTRTLHVHQAGGS